MPRTRSRLSQTYQSLLALALSISTSAEATYSIVAADGVSRQVGGAVTSCVAGNSVALVYRSVPGVGAVHAQALVNDDGRDRAAQLLKEGQTPMQALQEIQALGFDKARDLRQYGIVSYTQAVGFTGAQNGFYAGDRQGQIGSLRYSVQGNILTSEKVLQQSEAAFRASGCDLADKLMLALEAGALNGQGDSRCRPQSPADAAFLQVDQADGKVLVQLEVQGAKDPLKDLRRKYQAWRQTQPCRS